MLVQVVEELARPEGTRASLVRSPRSYRTSSRKMQARLRRPERTHFRSSLSSPNVTVSFPIRHRSKTSAEGHTIAAEPGRRAVARVARVRLRRIIGSRRSRLAGSSGKRSRPSSKLTRTSRKSTPITLPRTRCQRKPQSRRTRFTKRRCPCLKTSTGMQAQTPIA